MILQRLFVAACVQNSSVHQKRVRIHNGFHSFQRKSLMSHADLAAIIRLCFRFHPWNSSHPQRTFYPEPSQELGCHNSPRCVFGSAAAYPKTEMNVLFLTIYLNRVFRIWSISSFLILRKVLWIVVFCWINLPSMWWHINGFGILDSEG